MACLPDKPVLQLELGRTDAGISQILVTALDKKQTDANIKNARAGNNLDTFIFIPAYSLVLVSIGLLLYRTIIWRTLALATVFAVPIVSCSDWTENLGIAQTLHHLESDASVHHGDALRIADPSTVKWTLLLLILCVYSVHALRIGRIGWVALGLSLIGGIYFIASFLLPYSHVLYYGKC